MLGSASDAAYRLGGMADALIPSPDLADAAQGMLREASTRAAAASDLADSAAIEIGRILRQSGEETPWTAGWLGSRLGQSARAAQVDLGHLARTTELASRADPGPGLLTVTITAQWHAGTLESLAATCERLKAAVYYGYDRLPHGLHLKAPRATSPIHRAAATLKKAATAARRATSGPMQEALEQERKSGRCTWCGRPGQHYTYRGIRFDGLVAVKGERLCPACRDISAADGVNILVIDDRPSVPPYIVNTVRDKDTVHARVSPEHRGTDGRDAARRKHRRGGGTA
jgi:hypothetical protein